MAAIGSARTSTRWVGRLVPAATLLVLVGLTLVVWRQQVENHRALLVRHTENVSVQTARRLEYFVESRLAAAQFLVRHWSDGHMEPNRQRFEQLAGELLQELPGFDSLLLVPAGLGQGWAVRTGKLGDEAVTTPALRNVLEIVRRHGQAVVSPPIAAHDGRLHIFAVLPLMRQGRLHSYLVAEFETEVLIETCFYQPILDEFSFEVHDGSHLIYRYAGSAPPPNAERFRATTNFPLRNRIWNVTMVPLADQVRLTGWRASLAVPLLGMALSIGFATLVFLLYRRMDLFRAARDQALNEAAERERAERRQAALARKVLQAQEEERARISRDLHDELGQLLTALRFEIDFLHKRGDRLAGGGQGFDNAAELVAKAAAELRRICKGLRPPLLDDLGLEPAALALIDEFRERTGVVIDFDPQLEDGRKEVNPEVALVAYRILQESLTNLGRHSAAGRVAVSLGRREGELVLVIADDGRGFDPAGQSSGSGIAGMRERANLVNGTLGVHSAPGGGTRVEFRVPLATGRDGKELANDPGPRRR